MKDKHKQTSSVGEDHHVHRYDIPLGALFKRRPTFECHECGQKVKSSSIFEIINLLLFYSLLVAIVFSPELKELRGASTEEILAILVRFGIYVLAYLLLRYLIARFAPVVPADGEIKIKTAEELQEEAELEAMTKEQREQEEAEREALRALYRQYEEVAEKEGADGAAAAVEDPNSETIEENNYSDVHECQHELKETWKNYIVGKQVYYCKKCGDPLKMSKQQNNFLSGAFLVGVVLFLWGDLKNLNAGWGAYFSKVALVLLLVGIVQAVIIHTHSFDELTPSEMKRYRERQEKKAKK